MARSKNLRPTLPAHWTAVTGRLLLFAVLWGILTGGRTDALPVGALAVPLTTLASIRLLPPSPWSLRGWLRFLPYFLVESLRGGVDVAARAFHPRLPLAPALLDYPLRLPPGPARVVMADAVSLLPGTLSAELDGAVLRVHVLDHRRRPREQLAALEARIAALTAG